MRSSKRHLPGALGTVTLLGLGAALSSGCLPWPDLFKGDATSCASDGQTHRVGESFPSPDGCNTCTCEKNGAVACTLRACVPTPVCRRTGCSGELCSDGDIASDCIYRPEFACYQNATCGRQPDGACGFTPTLELAQCLAGPGRSDGGGADGRGGSGDGGAPPTACRRTGCSAQICADHDVVSTCEYRNEYACYKDATCGRQPDGACGFTPTTSLAACLARAGASDGGAGACDFGGAYEYGYIGGNGLVEERSFLSPGNAYRHVRTPRRGTGPTLSCSPALPPCGSQGVITAADIEAHDLAQPDVRAALAEAPEPLFGSDPRPVDGVVFEFKSAKGAFLVGGDCQGAPGCRAIPVGIAQLRDRLLGLDRQELATPACQSAGFVQ